MAYSSEFFKNREKKKQETEVRTTTAGGGYSSKFFQEREQKNDVKPSATMQQTARMPEASDISLRNLADEITQANEQRRQQTLARQRMVKEASDRSLQSLADEMSSVYFVDTRPYAEREASSLSARTLGNVMAQGKYLNNVSRIDREASEMPVNRLFDTATKAADLRPTALGARTMGRATTGIGAYEEPEFDPDEIGFMERAGNIGKAAGTGLLGGIAALGETIGVNMGAERDFLRDVGLRDYFTKPLNELDEQRRAGGYADRTIDPEGNAARLLNRSGAYTEAATEGQSAAGKFVTEGLISTAQNLPAMALGLIPTVGPALSLGTMSASAAGSRAYELQQQGVGAQEALTRGLVAGGIEAATEKIPLDEFLDLAKGAGGTSFIRGILRQMGTEAGEEAASYALNYLADKAARDPNAVFDPQELLMSAAGGAFSGGLMGGVGTAIGAVNDLRANQYQAVPSGTNKYQAAQNGTTQEQNAADRDLRALANEIADAQARAEVGAMEQQIQAQVRQEQAQMQQAQSQNQQAQSQNQQAQSQNQQTNPQNQQTNPQNQAEVEAERRAEDVSTAQVEDAAREQDVSTDDLAENEDVSTEQQDKRAQTEDVSTERDTEHGLVRNERSAAFGRETEDTLDRLAKRGGASIEIVDRLASGANAEYRNGAVRISAEALENDRAAALRDATMHELTHHIETSRDYEAFAELVQRAVARESDVNAVLAEIVNDYAREGVLLDEDGARRELVAKYAGEYLSSEENVRYLARENRGVFDRIREFLRDIVARFRGEDARTARELLKTFDRALESVGTNEDAARAEIGEPSMNNGQDQSTEAQYSRGRTISEINAKLASMTDEERATIVRENEQMQKQVAELRQQLRRTPKGKKDARAVRRSTIEILRAYDSKADAGEISERLQKLYDRQGVGEFDAERYYEDFAEAMAIARDILSESETVNDELSRQYKDMKKHIRETAVTLSEQDRYDLSDDYNDFRRRYFGKIKLTNNGMGVDTLYGELQNDYGLLFFPDSITHPAEQLERIGEVLDSLAPTYENQYAGNLNEASKYVALQLMRQGAGMEAASPTFADRAAAKLGEARQETREARNELRELTRQYDADTAALDLRNERVTRALEAERERRVKNEQRIKEHFKEVNEKRRERKHDRDARNKLLKLARRLDKMKTTPQNRAQIESVIGHIDLIAGSITNNKRIDLTNKLAEYEEAKLDPNFVPDPALEAELNRLNRTPIDKMDIDDVIELTQALRQLEHKIRTENKEIGVENARYFYEMADDTVRDVEAAAAPKWMQDKRNWYQGLMLSPERMMRRLTGYKDGSPLHEAAKRLSEGQRKQMDFKRGSYEKFSKWTSDTKFMNELNGSDKNALIPMSFVDAKGDVQTIELTPGEVISMYLHSKNTDSLLHIQNGGFKIADADLYAKGKYGEAYAKGTRVVVTPADMRKAGNLLTPRQRAFADAVHEFMNVDTKEAINATSVALNGFEKANVRDYYPIRTDPNFTKRDIEGIKRDGSIEGMGPLKERQKGSSNPILLENVMNVLDRQIENTSMYYGLAIPVRNFNQLLNAKGIGAEWSVKEALAQKWGTSGTDYIEKMLTDVQNAGFKSRDGAIFRKFSSNYAGAVLSQNLGVVAKQAASYPTAAGVVGWKPLAKALNPAGIKVDKAKVAEYTPLLWNRSIGFDTQSIRDAAAGKKLQAKVLNGIQWADVATTTRLWAAAEYYVRDHNKALDVGSEAYYQECAKVYNRIIEETQPNYSPMQRPGILRTDSDLVQAMSMFKTQSYQNYNMVYDAVENAKAKWRQYAENANEETKRARQDALLTLGRTISAQVAAAATISVMTALYAAASGRGDKLKDEEGNLDALPYLLQTMVDTAAGSFAGGNTVTTALRVAISGETYYGLDVNGISSISDTIEKSGKFVQTVKKFWDTADKDELTRADYQKMAKGSYDMFMQAGQLLGIPAGNVAKDIGIAARTVKALAEKTGVHGGKLEALMEEWDTPMDKAHAKYWLERYSDAVREGDTEKASWIFDSLQREHIKTERELLSFDEETEKQHVNDLIDALYDAQEEGRTDMLPKLRAELDALNVKDKDIDARLEANGDRAVRQSWEYQQTVSDEYLALKDGVSKSAKYAALTEEKQAALDERLLTYTRRLSDAEFLEKEPSSKWISAARDAEKACGLSAGDFLIAYEAQSGAGSLKKDGETITNSSSLLKMEAIYSIPGLTDKQREYLFDACNVGKKVRGYNKALVSEKLREMRKEADK